jgi:hypothetical protein
MPAINGAYLELRLSGGSGNTDPGSSLGGDASSERVLAQSATALSNITGVVIDYAAGNVVGEGVLTFTAAGQTLKWHASGEADGAAVAVGANGRYVIKSGTFGFLMVTVTAASLPGGNQTDNVTIANIANEVFDDVSRSESFAGDTEYRCLYAINNNDGTSRSVTEITRSGQTATATTSSPHGYATGQLVTISGAVETEYNGEFTITVTGASTFTYTVTGSPDTPATGTITCKNTDPFLDVVLYITTQPTPGTIAVGKDPAGVGDGVTRSVSGITRTGSTATATTAAPHGYSTGNTVRIAGADQTEYNGPFTITVTGTTTFTYTVGGTPTTPATGTMTAGKGVATTIAGEGIAPSGVTFTSPSTEPSGISLGQLKPGEVAAFWERRTIPSKNTVSNAETLTLLSLQTYF